MKLLLALALVASASAAARIRLRSSENGNEIAISYVGNVLDIPQHTAKLADARARLAALEVEHADLAQKHNHFIQVTYEDRVAAIETRLGIHRADINANDVDIANLVQKDSSLDAEDQRIDAKLDAHVAIAATDAELAAAKAALESSIATKQAS